MWNLIKKYPVLVPIGVIGGGVGLFGLVNDIYAIANLGLPNLVWAAIGGGIFLISVFTLMVKLNNELSVVNPSRNLKQSPPEREKRKTSDVRLIKGVPSGEPNYETWDAVDALTLLQAASLWAEAHPANHEGNLMHDAKPCLQMLRQEIEKGNLAAFKKIGKNKLEESKEGNADDYVYRPQLKLLAEMKDKKPKFLYPEERRRPNNPHSWMAR